MAYLPGAAFLLLSGFLGVSPPPQDAAAQVAALLVEEDSPFLRPGADVTAGYSTGEQPDEEEDRRAGRGPRQIPVDLTLAGGPLLPTDALWRSATDPDAALPPAMYSFSADISVLVALGRLSGLGLRVGYAQRRDRWESPDGDLTRELQAVTSRTAIHLRFRQRAWFRRVTPFFAADVGVDVFITEPRIGVAAHGALKAAGLGLGLGAGLEFFPTTKVAIMLEVRDDLSIRPRRLFRFYAVPTGTTDPEAEPELLWDLELPSVWNTLTVQLGAVIRF